MVTLLKTLIDPSPIPPPEKGMALIIYKEKGKMSLRKAIIAASCLP